MLKQFQKPALLLGLLATTPALTGFVLLSSKKATLRATPESPVVTFHWNGAAPSIKEKDKFKGGIYQDLDDKDFMEQLLIESLNIWNDVPGQFLQLELLEDDTAVLDPKDEQNSLIVEHSSNVTTAAYAAPQIPDDQSDTIVDCDINVSDRSTSAKELAFTLVHEMGHCLGLGHAHSNYNAIMGYSRSKRNLSLGADDIAGIIYLYPDPEYVDAEPKELVSCAVIPGALQVSDSSSAAALLLLLLLPLLAPLRGKVPARAPQKARPAKPAKPE